MKIENARRYIQNLALLSVSAFLAGCPCPACDALICGQGTMETMIGADRTCVVTPLTCGGGAHEQMVGGERECAPVEPGNVLECGVDTHEQEQAIGGERECVPGDTTCAPGQIEINNADGTLSCENGPVSCGEGTHEQAIGGERECVLDDANLGCGEGTHEQTIGGERECTPD